MALIQKLVGFENGILINGTIAFVPTSGVPSGATFNSLALGSLAFDSTAGITYQKKTDTDSSADWIAVATTTDIDAAIAVLGIPWLPDARVYNNTITTLPTGTAGQSITLASGEVVGNGQRVIFAGLTTGKGVYAYDQPSGLFNVELGAGSGAGASDGYRINVPVIWNGVDDYSTGNPKTYLDLGDAEWVEDNDVNRTALSSLSSSVYVDVIDTTPVAISKLDAALAGVATGVPTTTSHTSVTTATVVASFLTETTKRATIAVSVKKASNHAISDSFYIDAEHNGTATVDATDIQPSGRYNDNLGFNSASIAGLTYGWTLTGTGATQAVNLTVTSTDAVDVSAIITVKLPQ
jgi:hypothetical protein